MKFLIDFTHNATQTQIESYLSQNGCIVLKEWNNFDKIFLVKTTTQPPSADFIERISEEQSVQIKPLDVITLNPYYGTHSDPTKESITVNVNDTKDWWKNFSYSQPEFENPTLQLSRLGKNISVYVMDSGIDATHPEFSNASIVNIYSVTPDDFSDNKGHGTAIASVIAGKTCGITEATIKIVKIFDPNHITLEHELLDAIDAIINDHEDNTFGVLNCSWSIPKNEWVEHKLRILEDEGVFIVAAAGNNGTSIEDVTPASMLDVVTVGAYNQLLKPCDFSNYTGGSTISVTGETTNHGELDGWAPGEQIWAASPNGVYGYVAGTSIAAGIASAILACNISWWVTDTKERLKPFTNLKISTSIMNSANYLFSRPGLLDLDDNPNYQYSKNAIATLSDRNAMPVVAASDEFDVSLRAGSSQVLVRVYQPTLTKSIEFIDPLPANFEILPDGRLYGSPTVEQGPSAGSPYVCYTVKFKRTNIEDLVEVVTVRIYVTEPNFEPSSLPSNDPIQITLLQNGCAGFPAPCPQGFDLIICTDFCGTFCCGSVTIKTTNPCECGQ
jgi:hypothetical protein